MGLIYNVDEDLWEKFPKVQSRTWSISWHDRYWMGLPISPYQYLGTVRKLGQSAWDSLFVILCLYAWKSILPFNSMVTGRRLILGKFNIETPH
jgi:hypothetical protein